MTTTDYRLPHHVTPIDYEVDLDASPRRRNFGGELILAARFLEASDRIELHARHLKISEVSAVVRGNRLAAQVQPHPDRETVELLLPRTVAKGTVTVSLRFKGKLNPNLNGLYLAEDGSERAIVSQCEATEARSIFPCFDEPGFKATLKWTVRTDPGYVVVANGVLESRRRDRGTPAREVHRFKRTRVIPTYLAAVTIGKLRCGDERRVAGVPCRVWAGRGKEHLTAFANEITAQVLPWYQSYFGEKYNYHKLDQVAVPGFDAGAMENVGAIFYRQSLLLMDSATTSFAGQKRIAEVVAHEIAHQWFGNLVTMKWWDDLWLNEAFATWISYKAVDLWRPDWRMWDDFLEGQESALAADSLENTHSIYSDVKSPAEATELFDVITYEKGCAVLRMIESYLGENVFRQGIRSYVAAFKNSNAAGDDLWQALEAVSAEPVSDLMSSWIRQPGFPLVTVEASAAASGTLLRCRQSRYHASPRATEGTDDQLWAVPLAIQYQVGDAIMRHRVLLREREQTFELPGPGPALWVYPNAESSGFYRLCFTDGMLQHLLRHGLDHLPPSARMGLIEDQWSLVRCGLAPIEQFMEVLQAFRGESDYAVLRTLSARLGDLDQRIVNDGDRELLREFVRWLVKDQLVELGWDGIAGEPRAQAVRRATVVHLLGEVGRDAAVLREAEVRQRLEMMQPAAIEPNLAGTIVGLAALRGNAKLLKTYAEVYAARKGARSSPEAQARYLGALCRFETAGLASKVLSMCLDGTIPQEQLRTVLVSLLVRRASQDKTWGWLKRHWKTVAPRVGLMGLARLVEATGSMSPTWRGDVAAFFERHPIDEARRAFKKAQEAMALRSELIERGAPGLGSWLRGRDYRGDVLERATP